MELLAESVRWVEGSTDVHSGDNREHEGLDQRYEDLKRREGNEATKGEDLENVHPARGDSNAEHGERDKQDVTGEHVCEQTDSVAEGPEDERREQLDRPNEWTECDRNAARPRDVFEVGKAVVLDAHCDEHGPRDEGDYHRAAHASVGWHLEERDDLGDVSKEHEQEERQEKGKVDQAVGADGWENDLLLDEFDGSFSDRPDARWNQRLLPRCQQEDNRRDDDGEHVSQRDLVEADRIDDRLPFDEIGQRWEGESATLFSCEQKHQAAPVIS